MLYGRRRVGKTELTREFMKRTEGNAIYLYVDILEKRRMLESFSTGIAEQLGEKVQFNDWKEFFDYICEKSSKEKLVLAIDEFQRFLTISPDFITGLQRQWDERLRKCKLLMLLVGSSIGMIDKITRSSAAPLYGRVARRKIRPFGYAGARELLTSLKEEEKIKAYSVFGGTPYYLSMARRFTDINEAISHLVLAKNGILAEEPKNLMEYENFRTHASYNSIIQAIAAGKDNLKEISDFTGISSTTVPAYLHRMRDLLDLVDLNNPLLGKAKIGKYEITDNFFRFWYKFILPNQNTINLGNLGLVEKGIKENLDAFIGRTFEGVVKQLLIAYQNRKIKECLISFDQLGAWWDRSGNEIDLLALNSNEKTLIACEVKWSKEKTDSSVLRTLLNRTSMLRFSGKIIPMIVSRSGFTEGCLRELEGIHGISIDINELGELFDKA